MCLLQVEAPPLEWPGAEILRLSHLHKAAVHTWVAAAALRAGMSRRRKATTSMPFCASSRASTNFRQLVLLSLHFMCSSNRRDLSLKPAGGAPGGPGAEGVAQD